MQDEVTEKIDDIQKKLRECTKEKALLKLEKDKLQKKAHDYQITMKEKEEQIAREVEANRRKQSGSPHPQESAILAQSTIGRGVAKNTPYPEDARPNPWLTQQYEPMPARLSSQKTVEAHNKAIGGMSLHQRKQIVATASDDCTWKIWNMETAENIMIGEGHRSWISAIDFHPTGSHLVTSGADKCIKLWDFLSSSIAHTFTNVCSQPIWKLKFHDTGDFMLSAGGDGAIKLFDLHSLKQRQIFKQHTDDVNGLNFQPFTNFFVSGSADKTVSIWDMRTGLTVQTFFGHLNTVNDTQFSIGGQYISSCDSDGIVKVWDIRMVQEVMAVDTGDAIAHCCQFEKTGANVVVGCSDGEVKMVNIEKGEVASSFKCHEGSVNDLVISQDNTTVYTAGGDGLLKQWG